MFFFGSRFVFLSFMVLYNIIRKGNTQNKKTKKFFRWKIRQKHPFFNFFDVLNKKCVDNIYWSGIMFIVKEGEKMKKIRLKRWALCIVFYLLGIVSVIMAYIIANTISNYNNIYENQAKQCSKYYSQTYNVNNYACTYNEVVNFNK